MTYRRLDIQLPSPAPGVQLTLLAHQFGKRGNGRSVYLHAGLHADEHPGLLVLQHLLAMLVQLDAAGSIDGLVTVVPYANPIGMSQRLFGAVVGRFDFENGENFNRNFPRLDQQVAAHVADVSDRTDTPEIYQTLFADMLGKATATTPSQALKLELARLAIEHDIVLDLHCDTDCIAHVYASELQTRRATMLAEIMGAPVVMLEPHDAGGGAFDQVHSSAWGTVQAAGLLSEDKSGFSATIELRGQADVNDELAAADASNLLRFLESERVLTAQALSTPSPGMQTVSVFPLDGASHVPCPCAGVIVYRKAPGDRVSVGEVIAEVVRLDGREFNQRVPILSTVDGLMIVRQLKKLVRPGERAALLAGKRPVRDRHAGSLLLDF
ncbi:succinylglutamate desuccinylase/aspartoacylase family protein [Paraburkholderia sp. BR10954]|uniref:succinylglutamate desuccinylase/aspartoacylase domain-containing protein n=1 Tax=Paraburkholderia sp. BR10954 TaxID=3236995 RepID=UPI0034D16CB4